MSVQYDEYLNEHIANVRKGYEWILAHIDKTILNDILPGVNFELANQYISAHDASKTMPDEYLAYDNYFYLKDRNDPEVELEFKMAFLRHIQRNPHHWQHWVIIQDDSEHEGPYNIAGLDAEVVPFDIPNEYILEMVCDWWSFSWQQRNALEKNGQSGFDDLYEVFAWYNYHENKIIFSQDTRVKVNRLLDVLRTVLDNERIKLARVSVK